MKTIAPTIFIFLLNTSIFSQFYDRDYVSEFDQDSLLLLEIKALIKEPEYFKFIENHAKLKKFSPQICKSDSVIFDFDNSSGINFYLKFSEIEFDTGKHIVEGKNLIWEEKYKSYFRVETIDERRGYGYFLSSPKWEFDDFIVKVNGQLLNIPDSAYSDLYNPNFCEGALEYLQVFESSFLDHIYIYMSGADAAGAYSAKWIFNKNGYVTRIISTDERGIYYLDALDIAP